MLNAGRWTLGAGLNAECRVLGTGHEYTGWLTTLDAGALMSTFPSFIRKFTSPDDLET